MGAAVDLGAYEVAEVQILQATFLNGRARLWVVATSITSPAAALSLTVPDCVTEAAMRLVGRRYVWLQDVAACGNLDGQLATVHSSFRGSATATIR
jgi:hypothetical protein